MTTHCVCALQCVLYEIPCQHADKGATPYAGHPADVPNITIRTWFTVLRECVFGYLLGPRPCPHLAIQFVWL
jgi:hypothetical protein